MAHPKNIDDIVKYFVPVFFYLDNHFLFGTAASAAKISIKKSHQVIMMNDRFSGNDDDDDDRRMSWDV